MVKIGWGMLVLFACFLLGASVLPKLMNWEIAAAMLDQIGYPTRHIPLIGMTELVLIILILIPRTSVIAGILMTALLGGAIASNLRADMPLVTHTMFGVYLGTWLWVGLCLRSKRLRKVFFDGT